MIKHKDNLAKLLATENVTVQYRNCQTAMFDVENRVITLPIFKDDLSEPLLDLFIGHEVSHALHTPLEGLHETVSSKPVLKGYLNVIEDVRIEKMIKAKYPGLKVNMKKGYAELMDMDFFGVKQMGDDHVLSLIDKINLTTKVGEFLMLDFNDEERAFLDRAYLVETWDDVVALATEIYEWSQENENKEDDQPEYEDEQEQGDIPNETDGEGEEEGNSEEGPADQDEEGGTPEQYDVPVLSGGEDARSAMTEIYAHKFEEHKLRDNTTDVLNIPSDYFDHWKPEHRIQSNELFIEQIKNYKKDNMPMINHIARKLETKNKKIISLMVKEYEIKKAGSLYARARTAKTGAVDTLKLAKYQIVEDMFKRATILPEGKSHGIVCYIDWSGSMDKVAYSALEQAYIVAKFCRQVGIPHRIFLFTSHNSYDEGNNFYSEGGAGHLIEVYNNRQTIKKFQESSLVLSALIAYSCRSDFWNQNKAMRNDFMNDYAPLLDYYENGDRRYGGWMIIDEYFPYPPRLLRMGGTPLNGLLHTARYLLREQKSQYNLDFQNLILVTDGFSNKIDLPNFDAYGSGSYYGRGSKRTMYTDPITKRIHDLRLAGDGLTGTMGMVDYVKQETGASVTGYFIVRNKREFSDFYWHIGWTFEKARVWERANPSEDKWSECNKQGGVNFTGTSFDKLLFVKSITATGDDTLDDELVGAAKGKLKIAFSKNASSKIKSRFIVNQMIEGIQL